MKLLETSSRVILYYSCLIAFTAGAFQSPDLPELPDIDLRTNPSAAGSVAAVSQPGAAEPAPDFDAAQASMEIDGFKVELDPIIRSPKVITATRGFLTSPAQQASAAAASATSAGSPGSAPDEPKSSFESCRELAACFVDAHSNLFGHGAKVLRSAEIQREYQTPHSKMTTVVWRQHLDGIEVFDAVFVAHSTQQGELISLSSLFVPEADLAANADTVDPATRAVPTLTPVEAVVSAATSLGEDLETQDLQPMTAGPEGEARRQQFETASFKGPIDVRLVWLPMSRSLLRLCWEITLSSKVRGERFLFMVDAHTSEVIVRRGLTLYLTDASYRVFTSDSPSPFSPGHSAPSTVQPPLTSRSLVTLSALDTNASPDGWISDGVNETAGNNVAAHTDLDDNDLPDLPRPQGSPFRVFDAAMDLGQEPGTYTGASVVQLFYRCNWVHDRLYQLGFTEAAGNFQDNNFGRGGLGNDALIADAQDGSGVNNANYTRAPDGSSPRIQMYRFSGPTPDRDGDLDSEIVTHEYVHGLTTRLVGGGVGMDASQSRGMGEGWSDWYALSLLSEPGDDLGGAYAKGGYATYQLSGLTENYYFGIRRYPYSTDMTKNPLTFKDIDPGQISSHPGVPRSPRIPFSPSEATVVHRQGEVWCSALWEARANLIARDGFATGNELILQLVTDGLKLTPPNPNFIQARDAILLADQVLTGGSNQTELWAGFAKRGLGFSATSPSSSTTLGVVEAFDIPDDLQILPSQGFTAVGEMGGPFLPAAQSYLLTNTGPSAISWAATKSVPWLDVTSIGGMLIPGGPSASVTVSLNSLAAALALGTHNGEVSFSNLVSGVLHVRPVQVQVKTFASVPFTETFESGALQPFWTVSGTGTYRSQVVSSNGPHGGTHHLTMDSSVDSSYSRNEVTLGIDLEGYTNVVLTFWAREFSDEADGPPPSPFVGGADFDGVAISQDGVSWYEVQSLRSLTSTYASYSVDLDSLVALHGLEYNRTFRIRFNQYDNFSISTDGIAVDDIAVNATLALPRISVALPVSATEGDGVLAGQGVVSLSRVPTNDVVIALDSSDTSEVQVPASLAIPAGQTNLAFDVIVVDDADLDGSQMVTVTAIASSHLDGQASMQVHDSESATLSVALPSTVLEGSGFVMGTVLVSQAPVDSVEVSLTSGDPTEIQIPPAVIVPAGQTSAVFTATFPDDTEIDGDQIALVTASVVNWIAGTQAVTVQDNESLTLTVSLPVTANELDGILAGAGEVSLAGTLPTNLPVALVSSDVSELKVPPSTTIPAGQLTAAFDLEVMDDPDVDGAQTVTVTANAAGFVAGSATTTVLDDESPPVPVYLSPLDGAVDVGALAELVWAYPAVDGLVVNGGFEDGAFTGWTQMNTGGGSWVINNGSTIPPGPDNPLPPGSGAYSAMSQQTGAGTHTLFQEVMVPLSGSPQLRWAQQVRNHGASFGPTQFYRVEIRDLSDLVLATPFTTQPGDPLLGSWTNLSYDLSAFVGQRVRIAFVESDALGFFNVHLDDIEVTGPPPGAPITSDVYVGTTPILGPSNLVAVTSSTMWMPPQLAPLTTYYWQVIAHRVGITPGPIWQFTTKGVDHFDWSTVSTPQVVGGSFPVTITARDEFSSVVSNFTGTVRLAGLDSSGGGAIWQEDFEDGDFAGWTVGSASMVRAVTNDTTARGAYSLTMIGGGSHYQGLYQTLSNVTPTEVEFYVRANSATQAGGYVVLSTGPSTAQQAVFFYMAPNGNMKLVSSRSDFGVPYVANQWYKINLRFDWAGKSLDFYVNDVLESSDFPFRAPVNYLSRIDLYNLNSTQNWWDEIRLFDGNVAMPVAITPTNSGNFSKGAWAGQVTVLEPATSMALTARDDGGHQGVSSSFDVLLRNDLAVQILDAPDPVAVNGLLTNEITIVNSGPDPATSVTATNYLPPMVSLVSVTASQGSCSVLGDRIECAMGSLAGGEQAIITVVTTPTAAGLITNLVIVGRAEVDAYPANNVAESVSTVSVPALRISDTSVMEGDVGAVNAVFEVSLLPAAVMPVTVSYSTANGTAHSGSDYVATNGVLAFFPGQTNEAVTVSVLGDTNSEPNETFVVNLSNPSNAITVVSTATGTILNDDVLTLCDAVDACDLIWATGGNATWFPQTTNTHDGLDAGQSGRILHSQQSWLETTVTGPGALSYWWKVSSEGSFDYLSFYIDGVLQAGRISGAIDWAPRTAAIAAGTHTLRWTYSKDGSVNLGSDAGWLDEVSYVPARGSLAHFTWGRLAQAQRVNVPFTVALQARDSFGDIVSNYTGSVALSGWVGHGSSSEIVVTEVDTNPDVIEFMNATSGAIDISGWRIAVYDSSWPLPRVVLTLPSGSVAPAGGIFRLNESGTAPGLYPNFSTGVNIDWVTASKVTVLVLDGAGNIVDFMAAAGAAPVSSITSPVVIPSSEWLTDPVTVKASDSVTYQRIGNTDNNGSNDWVIAAENIGTLNPGLMTPFSGGRQPITIAPAHSGNFTNGGWIGDIQVTQPATNMYLVADDGNGHSGTSVDFDVLPNHPPIADAGPDQTNECSGANTTVQLDGSGSSDPDGDPLVYEWRLGGMVLGTNVVESVFLPLGVHNITLSVTDPFGASDTNTTQVTVLDTTSPALICPTNVIVEFTDENGALATYVVTATDGCSDVTPQVVPPSGSLFPIGATPVNCVAADLSGNLSSCGFDVTVLGAWGVKGNVLAELQALLAGCDNSAAVRLLAEAVTELQHALEPVLWIDQTHIHRADGDIVFHGEKNAVRALERLIQRGSGCATEPMLVDAIHRLVNVDRLLAVVSIREAELAGVNPNKIAEDLKQLVKGDLFRDEGLSEQAIESYRHAWKHSAHMSAQTVKLGSDGAIQIEFLGIEGEEYGIEASTNLVDWESMGTARTDQDGSVRFVDPTARQHGRRFYRVVEP